MTATFALFRNKDTGEQRVLEAYGDSIVVATELAELAKTSVEEGHLLVVWTTSNLMPRPAWHQVFTSFSSGRAARGIEVENGGNSDNENYIIVGSSIAEGSVALNRFRKKFASRLN